LPEQIVPTGPLSVLVKYSTPSLSRDQIVVTLLAKLFVLNSVPDDTARAMEEKS
jgi:hypothetical protein